MPSLLLIKPSALGDIVQTLPALNLLRSALPDLKISWVVKPQWAPLLSGHPAIDRLFLLKWPRIAAILRRERFDLAVDYQGLFRSGLIALISGAPRRIGFASAREGGGLFYTDRVVVPRAPIHAVDRYRILTQRVIEALSQRTVAPRSADALPLFPIDGEASRIADRLPPRFVSIHPSPGARWKSKRWPPEYFAVVADHLIERGWPVVFIGGTEQAASTAEIRRRMRSEAIDLSGRTTLPETAALLTRSSLLITVDSGPMHLASLLGRPLIALFGSTDPRRTGPYPFTSAPASVISTGIGCSPCLLKRCPIGHPCMKGLLPERVIAEAERILSTTEGG